MRGEISEFCQDFPRRSGHDVAEMNHMAPDPTRAGDSVPRRTDDKPTLPYAKAFVVQFTAETDARLEHVTGRIEHLQTGRRVRFTSMDDLRAGFVAMLAADVHEETDREPGDP
jgi:hypothetical protein